MRRIGCPHRASAVALMCGACSLKKTSVLRGKKGIGEVKIIRLRMLLSMILLVSGPLPAIAAVVGAVGSLASAGASIFGGRPSIPTPAPPPAAAPPPSRAPEAAPVQAQEPDPTSRQRARRAQAQARVTAPVSQTILTGALGTTQSPQNVRRTILGG